MRYIGFIWIAFLLYGCKENPEEMNDFYKVYGSDSAVLSQMMDEISAQMVIFGHQSVGKNILAGVARWEEEEDVTLNRVTTREMNGYTDSVFIDFQVGTNLEPRTKIDDFVSVVEGIPDETVCFAFFKFCYVDVDENTDVDALFEYYRERMGYLRELKPNVNIILFTTPLKTVEGGLKATAKKALSRLPGGFPDNITRNAFNDRIINEMSGDFPVFDLAGIESTLTNGKACTFSSGGGEYRCLAEVYSTDGGHLNELGSRIAAYNLIAFLAGEF
ncbi:MAG: hypothetical protein V2B15_02030 [Bacteroidota bacterium]